MEAETMRLLCILQIFFIGKTLGNFPITEYGNFPITEYGNFPITEYYYPVSAQFMNTALTAANANGLYPEVLPTSWPVFQQIEQNFPTFVNPIPRPEVISYQSNLCPAQIQPFPQLLPQPNLLAAQLPSLEIYPQNVQTVQTIPIRQDCDKTPILINTKYFTNGFGVNDVNCQRNVFGTLEVIDIPDVGCVNVEPPKIPYNIEINLPVLTSTIPNAPSYVAPYPMPPIMPPIIIEESSSSSGILKWLPLLVGLMSNNNKCNCNNNCNNCNCGCNCRYPFPFPISTSSPIINTVVPSAAGTATTTIT